MAGRPAPHKDIYGKHYDVGKPAPLKDIYGQTL